MTRLLEFMFVVGCSVVGFGMSAPDGNPIKNTLNCSVQLIALAHNNIASNTANFGIHMAEARTEILSSFRCDIR
jgi:hypothetical protein